MTTPLRIALVLRTSADYDAEYVERLCANLDRTAPGIPRVCLADADVSGCDRIALQSNWPGWWAKMELFRPDLTGDLLYMDLDTIPVASLLPLANLCNGHPVMLSDFYQPVRAASGLMYLPEGTRRQIWAKWIQNPAGFIKVYSQRLAHRWGDQAFIADNIAEKPMRWQDSLPGAVVSYKAHVKRAAKVPAGARIVCFHGKPRPRDVGWHLPGFVAPKPEPRPPELSRWKGATVFIVGGGPSAAAVDFESIRGRGLVVAINDSAKRIPWADVLFTADMSYVGKRAAFIRSFAGTAILAAPANYHLPHGLEGVERVTRMDARATSDNPMATVHSNSGFSALILAVARGASRVVLVGFDMNGPGHWFGEYEWRCRLGVAEYPDWVAQTESVAEWIRSKGCDVVNINPASAIRCFRFAAIEEV